MIADFIADKMARYLAGGMRPESAAESTRRELLAIYRRRKLAGKMGGSEWQNKA